MTLEKKAAVTLASRVSVSSHTRAISQKRQQLTAGAQIDKILALEACDDPEASLSGWSRRVLQAVRGSIEALRRR